MPLFRCFIRGDNFPGKLVGQGKLVGFYTTRFVEASSRDEAEAVVVGWLRDDPDLAVSTKHQTAEAKVYFEKIDEVHPETEQKPNKGFTFFTMGT